MVKNTINGLDVEYVWQPKTTYEKRVSAGILQVVRSIDLRQDTFLNLYWGVGNVVNELNNSKAYFWGCGKVKDVPPMNGQPGRVEVYRTRFPEKENEGSEGSVRDEQVLFITIIYPLSTI